MSTCPTSYTCSDEGLLLPIVSEATWPNAARATIYLVGLLWSFMAIAIIADIFMSAISTITSFTQEVKIPDDSESGYRTIEVKRWNGTVANLTLMALGSSAPEILLSMIEIVFNDFKSGELGPSTVVGSAAFNLMVICGVCVIGIPSTETRRIKKMKVFAITAVSSVFAYVWLIIILVVNTPDFVDLWEAIVTLLFFPILVIFAYILDKDYFGSATVDDETGLEVVMYYFTDNLLSQDQADKQVIVEMLRRLKSNPDADEKEVARLTAHLMEQNQPHSRAWYRINALRTLTGGTTLTTPLTEKSSELLETLLIAEEAGGDTDFVHLSEGGKKAILEFESPSTAVIEKEGRVRVNILRHGNLDRRVIFRLETIDGTAEASSDYKPVKKTMVFEPKETLLYVDIEIIDDNVWEPDEVFFVRLTIEPNQLAVLGKHPVSQVTILNDDVPGTIQFANPSFLFKESVGCAQVKVDRANGCDGRIVAKWKTKDITAVGGRDYENTSGEIVFEHGELTKMIEINVKDDLEFEKDENFEVDLVEVDGGAKLGKLKRCVVTIVNDDEFTGFVNRIADLTNANLDALRVGKQSWANQFREALNVNGGDLETATAFSYLLHFMTFGFKSIFALIPPPSIWGGWLCFIVSLIFIGLLTAVVADLANIFGCLIGLESEVTAITFVALGTSLPDLFASKTAATMEKHADSAIGNVTGSNSVNVFLGLGMAWVVASGYWTSKGVSFEVPAGSLGFSVVIFTVLAVLTLILIVIRRYVGLFGNAELGGPKIPKIISGGCMIIFWFVYVLVASLQTYGYIESF
ncbi:sodium/calcium exchanger 3-like isoform X1 [Ostrea edulis]|uniref:sodium/calcium exchanger 3-like isoform X1 n=1 Tax=Ostrea edulis TaxID=37623 RepID=UPI0024AEE378|nr:sodium/calcium exchanger 3-like isoform X1 [Ostrea edulis]